MEVTMAHRAMEVVEHSQPSAARYAAHEIARAAGFDDTDIHRAGIVATELATNLVKHGTTGGELLMRVVAEGADAEIEIIAVDRGPGMKDTTAALADGFSTAGSPGTGLGAVRRLSEQFDVHSETGAGTVVLSRLRAARKRADAVLPFDAAVVSVAMAGEEVCGDGWMVRQHAGELVAMVADGLGHGPGAAEAALAAVSALARRPFDSPAAALDSMHASLRHTRGAAVAVARIQPGPEVIRVAGLGNVATVVCGPVGVQRLAASSNGTLGTPVAEGRASRVPEYTYPWPGGSLMVMHSDGLGSHWSLERYRGLRRRHPAVIASVLYRDFSRHRDDVTVLVARGDQ
jgi:anti-sigma regulatory factor (Ser/Thr protein kinase)